MNYKYSNYCTNCGRIGHITKRCKDPVISFGIIIFRFIHDIPQLILIQRRNSMSYVEFLRGRYNQYNKSYIISLINSMTDNEINDLKTKNFETLWIELWQNNDNKNFRNDYYNSKQKFENIHIQELIKEKSIFHKFPEWGFPKGRRNYKEKDIDCATREFCEETGLDKNNITIIKNIIPIREDFLGNNNVRYRHIYYIAKIKDEYKDISLSVNQENKEQCAEISDIAWLNEQQSLEKIRDLDISKKNIITDICSFLNKINKDFYLKYIDE